MDEFAPVSVTPRASRWGGYGGCQGGICDEMRALEAQIRDAPVTACGGDPCATAHNVPLTWRRKCEFLLAMPGSAGYRRLTTSTVMGTMNKILRATAFVLVVLVLSGCTYVGPHSVQFTPDYVHYDASRDHVVRKELCRYTFNFLLFVFPAPGNIGLDVLMSEMGGSVSKTRLTYVTVDHRFTTYFIFSEICTQVAGHFVTLEDETVSAPRQREPAPQRQGSTLADPPRESRDTPEEVPAAPEDSEPESIEEGEVLQP